MDQQLICHGKFADKMQLFSLLFKLELEACSLWFTSRTARNEGLHPKLSCDTSFVILLPRSLWLTKPIACQPQATSQAVEFPVRSLILMAGSCHLLLTAICHKCSLVSTQMPGPAASIRAEVCRSPPLNLFSQKQFRLSRPLCRLFGPELA